MIRQVKRNTTMELDMIDFRRMGAAHGTPKIPGFEPDQVAAAGKERRVRN